MCTTKQYLYTCSHAATHRFRTRICAALPNRLACAIRDENDFVPYVCATCATKGRSGCLSLARRNAALEIADAVEEYHDTWFVPSRCFVDVGFRTLDPFRGKDDGAGGVAIRSSPSPSPPQPEPNLTTVGNAPASLVDASPAVRSRDAVDGGERRGPVVNGQQKRQFSTCCLRARQGGAYEATRLEGCEDRICGRIADSFCSSTE